MKIAESETKMEGKITSSIAQSEITTEGKIDTKIGVVEGEIGILVSGVAGIQAEIADLVAGLGIGGQGELGIIIDLIALNSNVDDLESDVEDLWNAIDNIDDKLGGFEEDITEIIEWKNEINIPLDFTEDINNINSRLDNYEEDIEDKNNKLDSFEEDISDINASLLIVEEDINDINEWREGLIIPNYEKDISEINNKLDS
jgi:hypothetical protein